MKKEVKYPVISECPVCKGDLEVVRLECNSCHTKIEGLFTLSKFNYLDTDKLYFIEIFVKNRGNIKAIEKELNASYPTVKKILDEVIQELGYAKLEDEEVKEEESIHMSRIDILNQIDAGKLSVEEASKLLRKLK